MTYQEETEAIKLEIRSLTKELDYKKELLKETEKVLGSSNCFHPNYFMQINNLKNNIISDEVRLSKLNKRLKKGPIARKIETFNENNPVEHVSGRLYRGTTLGLIVHVFITTCITCLVIFIIALVVTGIGSLFK
ncbi:MAG: hypothetical protein IJL37_09025 [Bacteroidaceae bacterium]|nr:hypothetical protein [Bacteroidaceae bacterium]